MSPQANPDATAPAPLRVDPAPLRVALEAVRAQGDRVHRRPGRVQRWRRLMQLTETQRHYWQKNLRITGILLAIWFFVTFVIGYYARELNFTFFGWPFGFVAAANALRSSGMTDALPIMPDTPPTCAFGDQLRRSRLSAYQ